MKRDKAKFKRELASREAVDSRRDSKTAYRDIGSDRAVEVARVRFGIDRPLWEAPRPPAGYKFVKYLGQSAMIVERQGGPPPDVPEKAGPGGTPAPEDRRSTRSLVDSSIPLWDEDDQGESAPVSVDLEDRGEYFAPKNQLATTTFAKDITQGITFPDAELKVRPVGLDPDVEGQNTGERVFFANVATDTDWLMGAIPSGAETFWQLRSPASPESFELALDLPESLSLVADGGGARVVQGDQTVVRVPPPASTDAQGRALPTTLSVDGDRLRVSVDHRAGDYAYPVMVDPIFVYEQTVGAPGWSAVAWGSGGQGWWYNYVGNTTGNHGAWSGAAWRYHAPGDSQVLQANYSGIGGSLFYSRCAELGISAPDGVTSQSTYQWCNWQGFYQMSISMPVLNACVDWSPGCVQTGYEGGNWAQFQEYATVYALNDPSTSGLWDSSTTIQLGDYYQPSYYRDRTLAPSGWTEKAATTAESLGVVDTGLGWTDMNIKLNGADSSNIYWYAHNNCTGQATNRCPQSTPMNIPTATLPEGWNVQSYWASDLVQNANWNDYDTNPANISGYDESIWKIDRSAPKIALSGPLWDRRTRTIDEASVLKIKATDGLDSTSTTYEALSKRRSGIKRVQVFVKKDTDPDYPSTPDWDSGNKDCPNGSCGLTTDFTFNPDQKAAGTYNVKVVAKDQLDGLSGVTFPHSTSTTVNVTLATGSLQQVKEGDKTARRVKMSTQRRTGDNTHVQFEYRRLTTDPWTPIPADDLRRDRDQPISSSHYINPSDQADGASLPIDSESKSPPLIWDVAKTVEHVSGDVQIRGWFTDGTTGEAPTQDVTFKYDPAGLITSNATAPIGPGSVNLLTGNFSVTETDASIASPLADLSVTRTYNSRESATGPLGPGWKLGVESVEAIPFTSLRNYSRVERAGELPQEYVAAAMTDATEVVFAKYVDETGSTFFQAQDDARDLDLEEIKSGTNITGYRLTASTGDVGVFQTKDSSNNWVLDRVEQPGSDNRVSYKYDNSKRVRRVVAPVPASLNDSSACDGNADNGGTLPAGCRVLDLHYDGNGRLDKVTFRAPTSSEPDHSQEVANYTYTEGRLADAWDPRISPTLKDHYTYDGDGLLRGYTPPGLDSWSFDYTTSGDDPGKRLKSATRAGAQTTVVYGVPRSGPSAPYNLSESEVAKWGQNDLPTDATAVFPADQVPGSSLGSGDYSRATLYYANADGDTANEVTPGGAISTTEHDRFGNVVRELTPGNRERSLAASDTVARSREIDTQTTYDGEGVDVLSTLEPLHDIDGGTARRLTKTEYDQGKPATNSDGTPNTINYHLPTTVTVSKADGNEARVTKTDYDWKLRKPTSIIVDPGGLRLISTTTYNAQGQVTKSSQPSDTSQSGAGTTVTKYWNTTDCSGHVEWSGMVCSTGPAAQPATGTGRPNIPSTSTMSYNPLLQPLAVLDVDGSTTLRTTTISYDSAGRNTSQSVSGSTGTALPSVTTSYSATTGAVTSTSTSDGTISNVYDSRGRLTSYTDAGDASGSNRATTSTTYDQLDRPVTIDDGKGKQTFTYNARGQVTQIDDVSSDPGASGGIGTITAEYDTDGKITRQGLPGGLSLIQAYDTDGSVKVRCYTRQPNCDSGSWIKMTGTRTIQDQWKTLNTTGLSSQAYTYDAAGRLTTAEDTQQGTEAHGCTTRKYEFDKNSNRTKSVSYAPASGGACSTATTATSKTHTYDAADRLIDAGYSYDALGRMPTVASGDAGGQTLSNTYYVNDLVRTISQNGVTKTVLLDPSRRVRARQTSGSSNDEVSHYSDSSDSTSWIKSGPSNWERQVTGIDGNLVGTVDQSGAKELQLSDLHGDVIATSSTAGTTTAPSALFDSDEFGVPITQGTAAGRRFRWLGAKQRNTSLASGAIEMGARVYVPQLGRFAQVDPVPGGSSNDYDYANQNPIGQTDLDGRAAACVINATAGSPGKAPKGKPTAKAARTGSLKWSASLKCGGKGVFGAKFTVTVKSVKGPFGLFGKNLYGKTFTQKWSASSKHPYANLVAGDPLIGCQAGTKYRVTARANVFQSNPLYGLSKKTDQNLTIQKTATVKCQ